MAWYDFILNPLADALSMRMQDPRTKQLTERRMYYDGNQRKMLKVAQGKADDNVTLNFTGLAVDRSVSMLVGGGVNWKYKTENTRQEEELSKIWEVNQKELFMQELAIDGAVFGTHYIRTDPLAILDPYTENLYTGLTVIDPSLMSIETEPNNVKRVIKYVMQYKTGDALYREEYVPSAKNAEVEGATPSWEVNYYEARGAGWKLVKTVSWNYPFPPIIHGKNLPSVHSVYGTSDIDDIIGIQDASNFIASNIRKIIRNQAHKRTWGKGFTKESLEMGSDDMPIISNPDAQINTLDETADLGASENHFASMRQAIFDIARVVDITSIKDKVGALTNFGLRVLYSDALSKNATKRLLYGEALTELNRRLLVIEGFTGEESRPPEIVWGPDLPQDEADDARLISQDLADGIVSKETASVKRGYKWVTDDNGEGEQGKIAQEGANNSTRTNEALASFLRRGA